MSPERQRFETALNGQSEPPYEYAVLIQSPFKDIIVMRSWHYHKCLEFLAWAQWDIDDDADIKIARRHTNSNLWRTDWQED